MHEGPAGDDDHGSERCDIETAEIIGSDQAGDLLFTGTTGTSDPQAARIVSMNGVAMLPLITVARLVTRGSFASRSGSWRIANGDPISGSQSGVPEIFMVNFLLRSVMRSRNDSALWTFCFPMTGPLPRMSP